MTKAGFGDDGSIGDLPWAAVFDPAANARALSAIQAEGFRAASRIVDRFVRAVGSENNDRAATTAPGAGGNVAPDVNGAGRGVQDLERLTRAWWSMTGQFLLRSMPVAAGAGRDTVRLDMGSLDSTGVVRLVTPVGGSATTEIWLHNQGAEDQPDVRLHCSDLLSHAGDVIRADAVLLDAAVIALPRRSSRGVTVTVNATPDVRPGVYRGTLLASGHPDLWLRVELIVQMPEI